MIATATPRTPLGFLAILFAISLVAAACGGDDATADDGADDAAAPVNDDEATAEDGADDQAADDGTAEDDGADDDGADSGAGSDFPREVETATGPVTIGAQPTAVVSLSPTATEMLFAIGAGDLVVAVDVYSDYPPEAPQGTLDGFVPDLEAILASEPDLVVATGLPEDVSAALADGGVPVMVLPAAAGFDDTYDQIAQLGEATGHIDEAAALNAEIRQDVADVVASLPQSDEPLRVFHEIDDSFYTATSNSFIGQVYAEMGFQNIADPMDDGTGFPLVDGESVIAADPSLIVYTSQASYGREDIEARPGWGGVTAVVTGNIVEVDADVASRWGPRIVEFMTAIADVVSVDA